MSATPEAEALLDATIEIRLRGLYDSFSTQEMRLADVILASPGSLATYSATELSEKAGVSKSTTTRFFRRLGYASYEDARRQARALQEAGSPLYLQHLGPDVSDLDAALRLHLEQEVSNIYQTYRALDAVQLSELIQGICNARNLVIIGYRHSHSIAAMLHRYLVQVRGNVHLLPRAGDTMAEYLCDLDERDLLICVGLRRRVPQLNQVVDLLGSQSVPILLISDVQAGRLASQCRWVIRCHTEGSMLFDSTAALASMCNLLSSLVAKELSQSKRSHLEQVERLHRILNELE